MKKILLLISSLLAISILVACQKSEEPKPKSKQPATELTQHAFPKNQTVIVTSLKMEMLSIKDVSQKLPTGEELSDKKLMKVEMKIGNMTEYNIPMAASLFKVLDSHGKYQSNYPMVDELGETISGNKVIHGAVYFAIPKDSVIEKIVFEDEKRAAFHEWAVEK
ncbi:DUF4352 domain-containing protein [Listeria rocourtiae]|uniref:DUF4352 domain-containing protein n=1 Tax=Listeria rocourtiae TaxID=647910 RepID=UPI0016285656|nr:DUF4352 domain-containing protein [Listeria rocourtiae]MBC1435191.1 DUF4352 domain-containing protein [Listeria rocourtiae]